MGKGNQWWRAVAASLLASIAITTTNRVLAQGQDDMARLRAERDAYREAYRRASAAKKAEAEEEEYGAAHSWELGGAFDFLWQSDRYTVEMSPSAGYFFYERFELSAIFTMSFENEEIEGTSSRETTQGYAFVLEPSYHIKIIKQLFIPLGLGTGVGYDGDNVDFELIPRAGLNIVFTHHGVLTPAVRVPILIDEDGTTVQVGAALGYTVAFLGAMNRQAEATFVSTGHLPSAERIQTLVDGAHARFRRISEGETSQVYPTLAAVPADLFGIAFVSCDGAAYRAGDADVRFAIMSVSKPFVFALVCQLLGPEVVRARVGVNSTGLPFNSAAAVEREPDGRTNPMVNAGAIATTSLAGGQTMAEKWRFIHEGLSSFAGRTLAVNQEVFESAKATNSRSQALARLLESVGRIYGEPAETTELYTKQCALDVSAVDLAVMGATLADGGVNPLTKRRVVAAPVCHYTLAVMATAGLYETSGDWLYEIGLPGKSGIGGGIVTVAPGKGGLGTFAPRLDAVGNSVKGQLVAKELSRHLGLDLFASQAVVG